MACPLCGDECRCSFVASGSVQNGAPSFSLPERAPILIDPEAFEDSEQQFASSVNQSVAHSGIERAAAENEPWNLVSTRVAEKVARVRAARSQPSPQVSEEAWREEIAARLEKYRVRRGRPRPEPSLRFDFDRPQYLAEMESEPVPLEIPPIAPLAEIPPELEVAAEPPPAAVAAPQGRSEPVPEPPRVPEPAKIIEFPRQPVVPPSYEELAEPILDLPRILEVPETVESESPLADITLPSPEEPLQDGVEVELPLQPAAMEQRVFAGVVDGLAVTLATGLFLMIAARLSAQAPDGKLGHLLYAALPCVLWAVYEYVFLVHAGTTPGMELARIGIATFDGYAPSRSLRRFRALAMMLAAFSLGLGILWALLDEDTLCWHDRITKTYPVRIPRSS